MSTAAQPAPQARAKFVPPFLAKLGLQPGEWMYASKLTLRALTRPSWPLKVRIWAFLTAQSFGYESDLAVYMRKAQRMKTPPELDRIADLVLNYRPKPKSKAAKKRAKKAAR